MHVVLLNTVLVINTGTTSHRDEVFDTHNWFPNIKLQAVASHILHLSMEKQVIMEKSQECQECNVL